MYDTYRNKRIFITGHTGFKGSWLTSILHTIGSEVYGFALKEEPGEMFDLINGDSLCQHHVGDIRDANEFSRAIENFKPNIIFHLAAQPLVLRSYLEPQETIETNVVGTMNLLEILRKSNLAIPTVFITTDKVYRNNETGNAFSEADALGGKDIYSASKAASEILIHAYAHSYPELNIATARAGNVIGGGDFSKDRIIPDFIRAYESKMALIVRNPDSVRPWQHVLESLSGYLALGEQLTQGTLSEHAFNFGPKAFNHVTVRELIELCQSQLSKPIHVEFLDQEDKKESKLLSLNSSLSNQLLSWEPKWSAEQAVKETIDWHKFENDKKLEITKNQIAEYFDF